MNYITLIILIIVIVITLIAIIDVVFIFKGYSYHQLLNRHLYQKNILKLNDMTNETPNASYQQSVRRGWNNAKTKSIVMCCLCRNIEHVFFHNKIRLEKIGSCFAKYKIVVFENDSTDRSRALLKRWEYENRSVHLLSCYSFSKSHDCKLKTKTGYEYGALSNTRISKMAFYRNQYLKYAVTNYAHYDYMLCFDFDIQGGLYLDGMIKNFDPRIETKWDALIASGYQGISIFQGGGTVLYDSLAYVGQNQSYKSRGTLVGLLRDLNHNYKKI